MAMTCPTCGDRVLIVMYPAQAAECYGTALATCADQKRCGWKTGTVPMTSGFEIDLEWRAMAQRSDLHASTVDRAHVPV